MNIPTGPAPVGDLRLASSGPPVDIGMPAYRRPQFVGEAIESVLAQTYSNWCLVVSENGPGGGEVEAVVRQYTSDPRITYVATGRNLGPAANWTRLLQAGEAPYFSIIQDDDQWDPEFLARRVAFLEDHPECGFVYGGERKIDRLGHAIAVEETPSLPEDDVADVLPQGIYSGREYVHALYRYKLGGIHTPAICSLGVMSRRSVFEAVGAVFDDQNYPFLYWDVELYLRMAMRSSVGFMAIKDATQRIHHPSITSEHSGGITSVGGAGFDGEYWIKYHEYHEEWFRRELPGFGLPREYDEILGEVYIMAALDAIEQNDRRRSARHLRSAVRRCPAALVNPRVAACAGALLLGRRGADALVRARAARRVRQSEISYQQ